MDHSVMTKDCQSPGRRLNLSQGFLPVSFGSLMSVVASTVVYVIYGLVRNVSHVGSTFSCGGSWPSSIFGVNFPYILLGDAGPSVLGWIEANCCPDVLCIGVLLSAFTSDGCKGEADCLSLWSEYLRGDTRPF